MNFRRILLSLVLLTLLSSIYSQGTRLLRQPTLSDNKVVFVYANDLWIADRAGGNALRLTSNEGAETVPHFSNDGSMTAFSAQYGGNTDVYVLSLIHI